MSDTESQHEIEEVEGVSKLCGKCKTVHPLTNFRIKKGPSGEYNKSCNTCLDKQSNQRKTLKAKKAALEVTPTPAPSPTESGENSFPVNLPIPPPAAAKPRRSTRVTKADKATCEVQGHHYVCTRCKHVLTIGSGDDTEAD